MSTRPSKQRPYYAPHDFDGIEGALGRPLSLTARRQIEQHVIAYPDTIVGVDTIPGSTTLAVGVVYTDEHGQRVERPLADDESDEVFVAWRSSRSGPIGSYTDPKLVQAEREIRARRPQCRGLRRPRERRGTHTGRHRGSRRSPSSPTRAGPGDDPGGDPPDDDPDVVARRLLPGLSVDGVEGVRVRSALAHHRATMRDRLIRAAGGSA